MIRGMPRVTEELIIVGRKPSAKLSSIEAKIQAKLGVNWVDKEVVIVIKLWSSKCGH